MTALEIQTPEVFRPLLEPSRYKGAFGGRGSGKSHFFAELAIERCLTRSGSRGVCIREVQRSLKDSAKLLLEDKIRSLGVSDSFNIKHDSIETPGGGLITFAGMQDHTADSILSLENQDWAWCEEAQGMSSRSIELLRPTIRAQGSEIWFSWNPRSADDPVDQLLRGQDVPPDAIVVSANWSDNPFFPPELEAERMFDRAHKAARYGHVWEGQYEPMVADAIWTRTVIANNRRENLPVLGRIVVAIDPAGSSGGDEHGIVVVGRCSETNEGYVLEDGSMSGTPSQWSERAIALCDKWSADSIVAETNYGGDMVEQTIRTARSDVRVIQVRASRGKHVRAEPIAALYSLGRVHHAAQFDQLEDQMCQMTASGFSGKGSPDRVDALVWGLTELFPAMVQRPTREVRRVPMGAGSWMS